MGLPQLVVKYNRGKIARYGINIEELNTIIRTAYAGEASGVVFENERKFDLVVRLDQEKVADLNLDKLFVRTSEGIQIPVGEVASIELVSGPLQINRDATKRRIVIGVNVRDADIQQVVANIQKTLDKNIKLQPGYYFEYGGQFENLQNAINTLMIVIPVALIADSADLVFRFQEHYLYIDGILHRPAVTYRRYRSPLAARTPVQHLGRSRFHRLVRCGCTERYPDGEPFQRTS